MPERKSKSEAAELLRKKRAGKWYADGVKFRCLAPECSDCCSGKRGEGYVWVNADEMEAIAAYLKMAFEKFTRSYIRQIDWSFSLIERPNHDCVFLKDGGCSIYEVRPTQCRTYPFWPDVMRAPETWQREGEQCPGIGADTLVDVGEIEKQLETDIEGRRRNSVE